MRTVVPATFPLLQAVVARSTANTKNGLVFNWNVESSTPAFRSWTAMATDPCFAAA